MIPLQVAWANSHGLFVIGPFMVLCYWVAALLRRRADGGPDLRPLFVLLALTTAATLATPFGPSGWRYAFLIFTEAVSSFGPALFAGIQELAPTFGSSSRALPDFWFFLAFLVAWVLASAFGLARRTLSLPRFLLTAGLCAAAFTGRRNVPLFILPAAPFIAEHARPLFRPFRIAPATAGVLGAIAILSAALPLSGKHYELMELSVRPGLGPSPTLFPAGLPSFLRRSGFTGQIFNPPYLGGYCLYHGYRPMIDTRWEVYDPGLLRDFAAASADPRLWRAQADRYDIRGLLLPHASSEASLLLPRLGRDLRWRLVWYDGSASFWVRSDLLAGVATVKPAADDDRRPFPSRLEECFLLGRFYQLSDAPRKALRCYEEALRLGGPREITLEALGAVQLKLGRLEDAVKTFTLLLERSPGNGAALRALSAVARARGDVAAARAYARRALEVNPADREARALLGRLDAVSRPP
jgi:hypothetical protein